MVLLESEWIDTFDVNFIDLDWYIFYLFTIPYSTYNPRNELFWILSLTKYIHCVSYDYGHLVSVVECNCKFFSPCLRSIEH